MKNNIAFVGYTLAAIAGIVFIQSLVILSSTERGN